MKSKHKDSVAKTDGFMEQFLTCVNQIKQALAMPEIYLSLSFYVLSALC